MVHLGRNIECLRYQVTYLHDDLLCQRISSQWDFSLRLEFICCKLTGCADFVLFQAADQIGLVGPPRLYDSVKDGKNFLKHGTYSHQV